MNTTGRLRRIATMTSVFRTSTRFRTWLVPLLIVLILAAGWWVRGALVESIKNRTADQLQAILNSDVTAIRIWLEGQEAYVGVLGRSKRVGRLVTDLDKTRADPVAQAELRGIVDPLIALRGYAGYIVVSQDGTIFAASSDESIGEAVSAGGMTLLAPVFVGRPVVTHPFMPAAPLPDRELGLRTGLPTMAVAGPVYGPDDRIVAVLALIIRPEDQFTDILQSTRIQNTGETYAFDRDGVLLSESRFDDQLRTLGLLPDDPNVLSLLTLQVRDPGGNLVDGFEAPAVEDRPLTRMAVAAIAGQPGVDVEGYRDYRGVEVVGAWTWLPEYELGVATELDHDEALAMPTQMRRALWSMVGILGIGVALVLGGSAFISRLGKDADRAVTEARTLGQYRLEKKIGAGGMGEVYRAQHAMLRRPTAVKLLHPGHAGKEQLARFEREVQITANLTHPNTIAVFDYGKTPDGVFYYAMEFLPGINLATLVDIAGPQSAGRIIHILRQACGSLDEAHGRGLIHRDIKPENIILCDRGGIQDVAKVLDFGIVKDMGGGGTKLTMDGMLSGTPHYVSPEALRVPELVDARADIYALGGVGYFLLTGQTVFDGASIMEICNQHLDRDPEPPSERLGRPVPPDLEAIVMACLAKDPVKRPGGARDLSERLGQCADAGSWTPDDAATWWSAHADVLRDDDEPPAQDPGDEHTATMVVETPTG